MREAGRRQGARKKKQKSEGKRKCEGVEGGVKRSMKRRGRGIVGLSGPRACHHASHLGKIMIMNYVEDLRVTSATSRTELMH